MMTLEQKQLSDGSYMQGVQIRVGEIAPILAHIQELLLLPKAMKWIGEVSFELAAYSEIQPNGSLEVCKFVNLRIRVPATAKATLKQAARDAVEHVRGWMNSISVESSVVHCDDEGLLAKLPVLGYPFFVKDKNRGSNPYDRLLLPLDETFSVDVQEVVSLLCQYPYSGVSLQLFADRWTKKEVSALNRFAAGMKIDHVRHGKVMDGSIVCFVCAAWGDGASALERLLVGADGSRIKSSALKLTSEDAIGMLAIDPWQIHKRLTGASRYSGVLLMSEIKRLFNCVPIQIAVERGGFVPNIETEGMMAQFQSLISQELSQMQQHSEEMMQSTQAWLAQEIKDSEARTEEKLVDICEKVRQDADQIVRQREDELKQQVRPDIQRAVDALHETVTKEMRENANQLVGMLESVQMDMGQLRQTQENLYTRMEKEAVLTERQLEELICALDAMSGERDALKQELLVTMTCGAERELSKSALDLLGVSSEEDLIDEGMTDKQLSILRIGMSGIEGKPVMNKEEPVSNDNTDYHPYVILFGFLYEQLMRGIYHDKIYVPYYCAVMGEPPSTDSKETKLSCYDKGPEMKNSDKWLDWRPQKMAERFDQCVKIKVKACLGGYWKSMFTKMRIVREIRNSIHSLELKREDAYKMVTTLFRKQEHPCLVRMILVLNKAEVDFTNMT